jgi:CBS domain-containing protein
MPDDELSLIDRLIAVTPFDHLSDAARADLATRIETVAVPQGELIFAEGSTLRGLFVIEHGTIDISSGDGDLVSQRGPGEMMGERGLLRDGHAMLTARAATDATLIMIPKGAFLPLLDDEVEFGRWFDRARPSEQADDGPYATGLMSHQVADMMARDLVVCTPDTTVTEIAQIMRARVISSILVMQDTRLDGIVTVHDLVNKVLAEGLDGTLAASDVMTPDPLTIAPDAVGLDALLMMAEKRINHLPVADARKRIVGMIGRTDLFRQQATTASHMASELVAAPDAAAMAKIMERLPDLLVHLTAAGTSPAAICRRITDLTDAITRRLLSLGEAEFGPPPVPYLWAACGSQGRREQTGVSDQDNCLIIDDDMTEADDAYFARLARFVSDGLNEIGFIYCPGDMMATNPRWRQPRRVWQRYFAKWIAEPDEEAQMLASVMFDLRPIAGETSLFEDMQEQTLAAARKNSIFVRHMIGNSLKHTPPIGFFGGLSVIRSGAHKNKVDFKHAGVVPVVDLGRVYALKGGLSEVNTRERITAAGAAGVMSESGARDLLDAYDLIAELRLNHQAQQIRAGGKPDNFFDPGTLSDLERNHLRDAFMIVRTMQSALSTSG